MKTTIITLAALMGLAVALPTSETQKRDTEVSDNNIWGCQGTNGDDMLCLRGEDDTEVSDNNIWGCQGTNGDDMLCLRGEEDNTAIDAGIVARGEDDTAIGGGRVWGCHGTEESDIPWGDCP
ncbi:hypothetical protein UA08_07343 [Talaromyces atroroseus]|uniref:Cyanovirin-N domain-containing protein n=1 Tax=Talaromyces atroroseus TaxID=1441469 RepID=A0A225AQ06_TALAT|nr:hypothetical protein UA08_07343 [Talaromyces atroroseus]OKL57026.1 hypothetical protein UA08_07343 [Talaromyces atroroseus]